MVFAVLLSLFSVESRAATVTVLLIERSLLDNLF